MFAAGALFLIGGGLTAAGILWPPLYDIGILLALLAAVGIVVRAGDWARVLLARWPAGRPEEPPADEWAGKRP